MSRSVRRAGVVLAALVVVLAAGCGGRPDADAGADAAVSPDEQAELENRREELVAECMRAKGWEYTPAVVTAEEIAGWLDEEAAADEEEDLRRLREETGYGITTGYGEDGQPTPGSAGGGGRAG